MLSNFLFNICGFEKTWTMDNIIEQKVEEIRQKVCNGRVILALSGGVAGSHVASPRDRRDERGRDGAVAAWHAGVFGYGHGLRDRRVRRRCDRSVLLGKARVHGVPARIRLQGRGNHADHVHRRDLRMLPRGRFRHRSGIRCRRGACRGNDCCGELPDCGVFARP